MAYEFKRFDDGEPLDVNKLNTIIDNIQQLVSDTAPLRDSTQSGQGVAIVECDTMTFENVEGDGTVIVQPITFKKIDTDAAVNGKVKITASFRSGLRKNEDAFVSVTDVKSGNPKVNLKVICTNKVTPRATYYVDWIAVENRI